MLCSVISAVEASWIHQSSEHCVSSGFCSAASLSGSFCGGRCWPLSILMRLGAVLLSSHGTILSMTSPRLCATIASLCLTRSLATASSFWTCWSFGRLTSATCAWRLALRKWVDSIGSRVCVVPFYLQIFCSWCALVRGRIFALEVTCTLDIGDLYALILLERRRATVAVAVAVTVS